jgi:hypothetical protein
MPNFPDDGSIAVEINRKLNLGQANKPYFFCQLKSQYYASLFVKQLDEKRSSLVRSETSRL